MIRWKFIYSSVAELQDNSGLKTIMSFTAEQAIAGQAVYSKRVLKTYDLIVLGVSNRLIWQCPTHIQEEHYNRYLTANHLDVGVGTGYFLEHGQFPSPTPQIALMDLNQNSLAFAAQRIAKYSPKSYLCNVLEPIATDGERFDSVGINYLLHCLPGNIETKAVIFDHLKALMNPNAVLFGTTLLQGSVPRSWLAKRLMAVYNKKGIFSNEQDDLDTLKSALTQRFRDVSVEVVGCGALFSGRI